MQQSNWLEASTPLPSVTRTKPVTRSWRSTGQQRPSFQTFASSRRQTSSRYAQMDFLSSLLASPVKTLALQENKLVTMESEVYCFMKSSAWLGSFNLSSSCLKMLEIYSLTKTGRRSKKPSFKLPKQGTMQNGQLFQQVMWEPVTAESESGLLPTPTTQEWKRRGPNSSQQGLSNTENWASLPTPVARDWKGRSTRNGALPNSFVPTGGGTYLNPSFVEEMMGYPVGWTDLSN